MTTHDPHKSNNLLCGVTSASFEKVGWVNHNVWMCVCTTWHVLCVYQQSMIHCGSQEQKVKKKEHLVLTILARLKMCNEKKGAKMMRENCEQQAFVIFI